MRVMNRIKQRARNVHSMGWALFAIGAVFLALTGCVIHVDPDDTDDWDRETSFSANDLEGTLWKRTITVENRTEYDVIRFRDSNDADRYLLVTENSKPHDLVTWNYSYKDYSGKLYRSSGAGVQETRRFTVDPNGKKLTFNDELSKVYHLDKD